MYDPLNYLMYISFELSLKANMYSKMSMGNEQFVINFGIFDNFYYSK